MKIKCDYCGGEWAVCDFNGKNVCVKSGCRDKRETDNMAFLLEINFLPVPEQTN